MDDKQNVQLCVVCINLMHGSYRGTYKGHWPHMDDAVDPKTTILNWNSSASFGLTLFRSNFFDYV